MIIEKVVVGPFASNCYVVGSESDKKGMIIDPGDEAEEILSKVENLALDIKYIALTHGHIDHIGALKKIKEATGAEVAVHADDAQSLKEGGGFLMSLLTVGLSYPAPLPPDRLLKDGDSIDVSDFHLLVLHNKSHRLLIPLNYKCYPDFRQIRAIPLDYSKKVYQARY